MKPFVSSRRKRSRRIVLWALALLAGSQLAVGLLLDYAWPLVRFYHARLVLRRLEADPVAPDVLVLGSSRLENFSLPSGYPGGLQVFNAAIHGGDHSAQEAMWQHVRATGATPRLVLVETGPEFLGPGNRAASRNAMRLLPWHGWPAYVLEDPSAWRTQALRLLTCRLLPVYHYRNHLRSAFLGDAGPVVARPLPLLPPQGISPPPAIGPVPELTDALRKSIADTSAFCKARWLADFRILPRHEATLRRLIASCRDAGAEVVLVSTPLTQAHRECHTPEIEAEYQRMLTATGCRHVDCRSWMEDGWFYDSEHLGNPGGAAFAHKLAERVLAPWMREARLARR